VATHLQLAALDRRDGAERLVVRWLDDGQRHAVEMAEERRTLDGWVLRRRLVVQLSEVHLLRDALDRACALAGTARR
jgi:hypothetical protein